MAPIWLASFLENDSASRTRRDTRCRSVLLKCSIDAPTKALVKTRRLEVDGIEYPCSTTTPLRLRLSKCEHARADITPAQGFWEINQIDKQQSKRRAADDPAAVVPAVGIADEHIQRQAIGMAHLR